MIFEYLIGSHIVVATIYKQDGVTITAHLK